MKKKNWKDKFWVYCENSLSEPANEIWGKVMLLHTCVILFTWGCWLPSMHHRSQDQGFCIQGKGACLQGKGSASRERGGGWIGQTRRVGGRYASCWNASLFETEFFFKQTPFKRGPPKMNSGSSRLNSVLPLPPNVRDVQQTKQQKRNR